jgi:two-component system phosphate regulon response regulator OmpR
MFPPAEHILVVDSDARRRQLSERVLGAEGFAVTAVAEAFSAIRAGRHRRFALVVAALHLPGALDGAVMLRQLRIRQPALKALFTGPVNERDRQPAGDGNEFIASPFDRRDLLGCVFELLQRDTTAPLAAAPRAAPPGGQTVA